jgi:hypothetical protein
MPLHPVYQTPPSPTAALFIPDFDPSDFNEGAFDEDADEGDISNEYYVSRVGPLTYCRINDQADDY